MKNKYIAWILGLLLWWLWVHKFYLWKWFQWILYILFTWTYLPFILAIIEWLVYLLMSKEKFNEIYSKDTQNKTKRAKIKKAQMNELKEKNQEFKQVIYYMFWTKEQALIHLKGALMLWIIIWSISYIIITLF